MSKNVGALTPSIVRDLNGCIVVLDTETTGFSPYRDRIVEFGAIKLRNGREVDRLSELINPGFPMRPENIEVHGITDEMVSDKPSETLIVPKIAGFLQDAELIVGHNVSFDLRFLDETFKRNGRKFDCEYVDTLTCAKYLVRGSKDYKLGSLAEFFGIETPNAHRALADVETTIGVLRHLCFQVVRGGS